MNERAIEKIVKGMVSIIAIIGLVILELKALEIGMDGMLFGVIIATIAGLAGFNMKDLIKKI